MTAPVTAFAEVHGAPDPVIDRPSTLTRGLLCHSTLTPLKRR